MLVLCSVCSAGFAQDIEGMVEVSTQVDFILLQGNLLIIALIKCYIKQLTGIVPVSTGPINQDG